LLDHVALWSGEKKYIINSLLKDLIERCRELELEVSADEKACLLKVAVYVTAQIVNYLYTGRYRKEK
jgi:hypothetical protein